MTNGQKPDQQRTYWNDRFQQNGHTGWSIPEIYRYDQKIRVKAILSTLDALGFGYQGRRALDIGCGTGDITEALAVRGTEVVGYDISSGVIEQARLRFRDFPNVTLECANLVDADISHGPFDLITSVTVLQHQIEDDALATLIDKLSSALKPGGRVVMLEHVLPEGSAGKGVDSYIRPRTRSEWLAFFGTAGLRLEHERSYPQNALTTLSWARGVIRSLRPGAVPTSSIAGTSSAESGGRPRHRVVTAGLRTYLAAFVPVDYWLRVPTPKRLALGRILVFKAEDRPHATGGA